MTQVGDEVDVLIGDGTIKGFISGRNNDGTVTIRTFRPIFTGSQPATTEFTAEAALVYRIKERPICLETAASDGDHNAT